MLARSARQFFQHARFDPSRPPPDDAALRALVRRVVDTSPRRRLPDDERVTIPGFASLRDAVARARGSSSSEEIGGPLWSYLERGNWRMVIPFGDGHQAATAESLVAAIDRQRPPIVHLVRFPHITINHAVLLYEYQESEDGIRFAAYDPNAPDAPVALRFDRSARRFHLDRNAYFQGGRVDVYEIYHRPWY